MYSGFLYNPHASPAPSEMSFNAFWPAKKMLGLLDAVDKIPSVTLELLIL